MLVKVFLILLLFFTSSANSNIYNCVLHLLKTLKNGEKVEYLDDKIALIYYPDSWHFDVMVDGWVYNKSSLFKLTGTKSIEALRRSTSNSRSPGYIAFSIKVTPEELERIKIHAKNDKFKKVSCVRGACKTITRDSSIILPDVLSFFPLVTAIQLGIRRHLPYSKISKIDIMLKPKDYIVALPVSVMGEGIAHMMGFSLIYLIYVIVEEKVDQEIRKYKLVIPIHSESEDTP